MISEIMSTHFSIQFIFLKCLIIPKYRLQIDFFFPQKLFFFISCFSSPKAVVELYRYFFVILVLGAILSASESTGRKYALTETICVDVTDSNFTLKP